MSVTNCPSCYGHPKGECPDCGTREPEVIGTGNLAVIEHLRAQVEWLIARKDHLEAQVERDRPVIELGMQYQGCPTACDDDCDAVCHEGHQIERKRWHSVEWCQQMQAAVRARREEQPCG